MKIYDDSVISELKNGSTIKMIGWGYEENAYVSLEGFYDSYVFILNRQYPNATKEIFVLGYDAIVADWEWVTTHETKHSTTIIDIELNPVRIEHNRL